MPRPTLDQSWGTRADGRGWAAWNGGEGGSDQRARLILAERNPVRLLRLNLRRRCGAVRAEFPG
jgi:hypothetical protein